MNQAQRVSQQTLARIHPVRRILPRILQRITGTVRYMPKIEWSNGSYTHNVFRAWEYIAGREYGVRREFAIEQVKENGKYKTYRYFFTKEAAIAHIEGVVRQFFREGFAFERVQVCVPAFAGQPQGMFGAFGGQYLFAIARNTSASELGASGSATRSVNMSITGSDRVLVFFPYNDVNTRTVSTKTYAGVDFGTVISANNGTNGTMRTYMLAAPSTTASSSLSITYNSSTYIALAAIAYTGCEQASQSREPGVNVINSSGTSITASINIINSGAWIAARCRFDNGGTTSGSGGLTLITNNDGLGLLDSNGTVSTGTNTPGASCTIGGNRWINTVEVDPPLPETFYQTETATTDASATVTKETTKTVSAFVDAVAQAFKKVTHLETATAAFAVVIDEIQLVVYQVAVTVGMTGQAVITRSLTIGRTILGAVDASATVAKRVTQTVTASIEASVTVTTKFIYYVVETALVGAEIVVTRTMSLTRTIVANVAAAGRALVSFYTQKYPPRNDDYTRKY